MAAIDVEALGGLLDDVRRELRTAVDDLERSRAAHRRVETLLLAVLDNAPSAVVVVDAERHVRALTAAAETAWGVRLDGPLGASTVLAQAGVVDAAAGAAEAGHVVGGSAPEGFGLAVVDEPGTGDRYVVVWSDGVTKPRGARAGWRS